MHQPLVSVIIPAYNYGYLISETIQSLLNQDYQSWEAIIVDDGSTDNTNEVVGQYLRDSRIKYFHQANKGLSEARNTGLSFVNGEYLCFLDADDLISNQKIGIQVKYMEHNKSSTISYCNVKYFRDGDFATHYNTLELDDKSQSVERKAIKDFLQSLIKSNFTPVNTPLVRTSFVREKNLRFNKALKALEDWDFWLRCAFNGAKFDYVLNEDALAFVRVHKISMSYDREFMYKWEIELRKLIPLYINQLDFGEIGVFNGTNEKYKDILYRINIRKNEKCKNILYRMNIRRNGILNIDYLRILAAEVGFLRVIKLVLKEVNAIRRNR